MMKVVSHRPQRAHDHTPRGRLPYRQRGRVLSLTGFANSIRTIDESVVHESPETAKARLNPLILPS
jgi:hypothetical protein